MGFGDSFKKKIQGAAKAVEKAATDAVAPKPAAPASKPVPPPANKPFPAKPTPMRAGASKGPMFGENEKTVLDDVLQARIRAQKSHDEEPDEVDPDAVVETDDDEATSAEPRRTLSYGETDADDAGDDQDEAAEDEGDEEQEAADESEDDEDGASGGYHQADGLEFPVPVGWGVSDLTNEEFWIKVFDLENAQAQGNAAFKKALRKYDLDSEEHFRWIRERFMARHAEDPDFQQAMINARMGQMRGQMADAAGSELLEPIEGVSMEVYATIQARRGTLQPQTAAAFGKLLAEYGLDERKWARVDKAWMARMSDPSDPMATAAVNTEYGKYFAAAASGKFAAGAKAGSKHLGVKDAVGKAPSGGEPCTFERYIEIQTAQSCWAQQGKDVNAMLKKAFNMTAIDYSNLASYWTPKMMADIRLMTEVMPKLQAKYEKRYAVAGQDDDLDL